jgi:hypothetical protein
MEGVLVMAVYGNAYGFLVLFAVGAVCGFGQASVQSVGQTGNETYFPIYRVSSNLVPYIIASGDRLQKPGKERITVSGTIQYGPAGAPQSPIQVIWQLPLQIRVDQGGPPIILDGSNPNAATPAEHRDSDLIETLQEDSLESLLNIQDSVGSRHWGSGYRANDLPDHTIPYDIVSVLFPSPFHGRQSIAKTFWFDSHTKLLARITYTTSLGDLVDVHETDWRVVQGEHIPFSIERMERGQTKMLLKLTTALVSQSTDSTIFRGN